MYRVDTLSVRHPTWHSKSTGLYTLLLENRYLYFYFSFIFDRNLGTTWIRMKMGLGLVKNCDVPMVLTDSKL